MVQFEYEVGQKTLRNIEECLLPLMPRIGKSFDQMRKARWLFAKSKITSRRASLDSLKLTMTLFLHAIDRVSGDADEAETKEEIENLLGSAKNTKMNFIKAEIFDQAVEHHYEPSDKDNDFIATPIDDDNNNNNNEKRPNSPESSDSENGDSESYEISLIQNGYDYSKVDLSQWVQKHKSNTRIPLQIMLVLSDDQFVEIADHLKVQMAVTSYALVIISGPSSHPQARSTLRRSIDERFSKASSKGIPETQSIAQSEDSLSDGGMESMTNTSETMEDRLGSSWKYTLPNRQEMPRSQPSPRGNENNPADPFLYKNKPSPPNPVRQPSREPPREDPEKLEMKKQLDVNKAEYVKSEAKEQKREFEARIREETEREFRYKLEERDRQEELLNKERAAAAERAKIEIEEARYMAEQVTRDLMEKERQAAEERRKEEAAYIARAQQAARDQIEAERRADESRKKLEAETLARAEQAAQFKLRAEMEAEAAKKNTKGGSLSFFKRLGR
ncbi:hypothetical protein PFICI_10921 [Pestalotiopsis fici W106-1]|uniref:Uncharacterized protein n=1 Tax=Pestalotiopsis fici (strain W106-1 / CGMCC3.15140) TaxID=1229662 RepID=W3WV66_PESFW|nr:uncharacterized protein PFICI_10921 [Pestalotiopsis fici W106-1]ETS77047.1 hypothetical protein PFICI_10921 [Pestalotiopsis fici W106-1]